MTKKLEILKASLEKKHKKFNDKLSDHFADVASANGQPLNDKRNGAATMNRWERQNESLRNQQDSIEKTEAAIEREESKIAAIEASKEYLPPEILALIESGTLVQWRKYPHICFVEGVDKARIVWDKKKKIIAHKYTRQLEGEQRKKFAAIYNPLYATFNQ